MPSTCVSPPASHDTRNCSRGTPAQPHSTTIAPSRTEKRTAPRWCFMQCLSCSASALVVAVVSRLRNCCVAVAGLPHRVVAHPEEGGAHRCRRQLGRNIARVVGALLYSFVVFLLSRCMYEWMDVCCSRVVLLCRSLARGDRLTSSLPPHRPAHSSRPGVAAACAP